MPLDRHRIRVILTFRTSNLALEVGDHAIADELLGGVSSVDWDSLLVALVVA